MVGCPAGFINFPGGPQQAKQRITANHFGKHDQRSALPAGSLDQLTPFEQLFGILRWQKIAAHLLTGLGILDNSQFPVLRVVHETIVRRFVIDGGLNERMRSHVGDTLASKIDLAVVFQAVFVLLNRA